MAGKTDKQASKSFLLRLDAATMAMVEEWAAQEFRSVNGQLQWIVNEALKRHGRKPSPPSTPEPED